MPDYQSPIPTFDEWTDGTYPDVPHPSIAEEAGREAYTAAKRAGDEALEEQQAEIERLRVRLAEESNPNKAPF